MNNKKNLNKGQSKVGNFYDAQEEGYAAYESAWTNNYNPAVKNKDMLKKQIEGEIDTYNDLIKSNQVYLEKLKKMRYDVGQAVFNKSLGNVIIKAIYFEHEKPSISTSKFIDWIDGYVYEVVGINGASILKEEDIIEITNISKSLYNE